MSVKGQKGREGRERERERGREREERKESGVTYLVTG